MIIVSLGKMDGLMIVNREVNVVGSSMQFPLGSPLDYPNLGVTDILLGMPVGNPIGSRLESIWQINWCGP